MLWYKETVILRIFCLRSYCIEAFNLWEEEMCLTSLEVLFPSSDNGQWEKKYHHPYCSSGTLVKCFSLGSGPRVQDAVLYQCVGVGFLPAKRSFISYKLLDLLQVFPCCWDNELFLCSWKSGVFLVVVIPAKRAFEHVSQREKLSSEVKNLLRKMEWWRGGDGSWFLLFLVISLSFPNCVR